MGDFIFLYIILLSLISIVSVSADVCTVCLGAGAAYTDPDEGNNWNCVDMTAMKSCAPGTNKRSAKL